VFYFVLFRTKHEVVYVHISIQQSEWCEIPFMPVMYLILMSYLLLVWTH